MSAFIVSENHINALVNTAVYGPQGHYPNWSAYFYAPEIGETLDPKEDPSTFGAMLWAANFASTNARYDEHDTPPAFTFTPHQIKRHSVVAILKALDCYEYQCCESEQWETSNAKAFCEALRKRLISRLPGYDEADWEIA